MSIVHQDRRDLHKGILFLGLFDLVLWLGAGLIFGGSLDDGFSWLFAIWMGALVFLARDAAFRFLNFYLLGDRQRLVNIFAELLNTGGFPAPPEWMRGAGTYLEAVRDDEKLEAATRIKAAEILGTLSPMPSFSNVVERHLINIAFEEALRGLGAAGRVEGRA